ncbi:hypothetical protein AB205_0083970 [Aquarana catesbeiana]|uniref:Uncharacterized protein n=1 Tax=Aquarana catesbeiana TaxID=8400 RepID=A0A2G9RQM8_AQUCT|nr:hypothetical protein AB205_0083970 [Aquarana catesbeiana]
MMKNRPPLTSPDGSSNRNPPERCSRPLYSRDSTQEHQEILQEDQDDNLITIKVEVKEEADGSYVSGDESCMEEEVPPEISTDPGDTQSDIKDEEEKGGHVRIKEEDIFIEISTGTSDKRNPPERCAHPLYSRDSTQEDQEISEEDQVD